ncbi:MAG: tetratricopeptide repeat protein [Bacteriovoracia bacterium]
MFQQDPKSKIFAPLAEAYRKIGLVDEAIQICNEGLEANPDFVGGKVALARAYFDKKWFSRVRSLLGPVVSKAPDNLIAQKLYADSSLNLGYLKEALEAYKMVLYFNPGDRDVVKTVEELETNQYMAGGLIRMDQNPAKVGRLIKLQRLLNRIEEIQSSLIN